MFALKEVVRKLRNIGPNLSHQALVDAGIVMRDSASGEVQALLSKISSEVKEAGLQAMAEIKKVGEMSAKNKDNVDEMLVKQGELQARLSEIEKRANAQVTEAKIILSVGNQLVEDKEFKAWIEAGGMRSHSSAYVFPFRSQLTTLGNADTKTTTIGVPPDMQRGIIMLAERRMTIRDLITPGRTTSNLIQYVKESGFTNNAATVSETVQKPESNITYALMQSAVVTIAHWIKASKQILDDFAQLQSNIDGRLRYGLALVEEAQLLKGSGVGNNLNGIYTQATAYSAPIALTFPSGIVETKIDRLRLMLLQSELAEYPATGIVLHPADWTAIELTKDSTGAYIFANPQSLASPGLWGRPVVPTQAMTQDTALVGAFRMGAQVFDREDANVVISSENQDDFIKNMLTIRAEERLGLAVYRPEAFIKDTNLPSA